MIRNFSYTRAYRQGEILIFKVKKVSLYPKPDPVPNGVIRIGEKEGHEHKVEGPAQLSMFSEKEDGIIKVEGEGAVITHPEHKDIKLPKGDYVVKVQKEATGQRTHSSVKD